MQDGSAPWQRQLKRRKLRDQQQEAGAPDRSTAATPSGGAGDADDELDQLTSQYAAEAEAEAKATAFKHETAKQPPQKGMQQLRTEGLATALPADNRGFQLLQRMGWAEGQGLGAGGSGRAAPVAVELKTKRTGLGIDEGRRQRKAEAEQQQADRAAKRGTDQQQDRVAFRESTARRFDNAIAEKHVTTARKTIETLDERGGVERHQLWPLLLPPPAAAAEDAEAAASGDVEVELPPWEVLPAQQRLADVLEYLRERHLYCLFCGCQFSDAADMAAACPGPAEDDH